MGSGKRTLTTAAIALVCAVSVLGAPGAAHATPSRPTPAPTPSGGPTAAPDKDLEAIRQKLNDLYHDAAVATDAYNAAEEKADKQSKQLVELAQEIVKGQEKLTRLKDRAGAAARAQYRGEGLPPEVRLWLSRNPQEFLDGAGTVRQGEHATQGMLTELTRTQDDLKQYANDASEHWKTLEANRKAKAEAKKKIEKQIGTARKVESRLKKQEQQRLRKLEEEAAKKAQASWLGSGILREINGKASEDGRRAVDFATDQIGKPYQWGAVGPKSYDCSGLTSKAWAAAGTGIPRTSQEQWRQLRHVGVKDMRPGDLIIYFKDASHVGMYVGDGTIVHAPRPGRTVTLTGAGTMPILGVVRPDA
ncbi:C40 family peptidase [Streptomyces sp. NPDC052051]|uniref:C40 family peptidase n=1 Tax=Streptomyces sp. NPDC052051 TaxID=3154649 RepID=UPI00343E7FF6